MKNVFLFIGLGCIILSACNSSDTNRQDVIKSVMNDSTKFTHVSWKDTTLDFGTRKMGDIVNLTFICTNTGDKPLYITDVHPSCGCTLADFTKEPIAPGKTGRIDAQFDTKKSHSAEVHKTIFVHTNTDDPARYLSFSGTVIMNGEGAAKTVKQ